MGRPMVSAVLWMAFALISSMPLTAEEVKKAPPGTGGRALELPFGNVTAADIIETGNLVVQQNTCLGSSCSTTDADFSALKIKSDQPNVLFDDTPVLGGSPSSHDWALFINHDDIDQFSIVDFTNTLFPFSIAAGAPDDSLHIADNGYIGLGTAPLWKLHLFEDAPTYTSLMLENRRTPPVGGVAGTSLELTADVAAATLIAHSSRSPFSFSGTVPGNWIQLYSYAGNGLQVGTLNAMPLVLGTNNTRRMEIGAAGGVTVVGNFTATGTKNFAVADPADSKRAIYFAALEGPEAGTYFRGTAKLKDGEAVIELPGSFTRVTEPVRLTVQLTPLGLGQIYVAEKSLHHLVVRAAPGISDLEFDFLVQGVRKGYLDYEVERPNDLPQ